MNCPKCGVSNDIEALKCTSCGQALSNPGATQSIPAQPQPTQSLPPQPQRPPTPPPQPAQYYPPQQPYQQPPYGQQPGYPYQPMARPDPGNTLSIVGIVLGAISLFFCPLLFGVAGIVLGAIGKSKGEKLGLVAIAVSISCMVIGMIVGAVITIAQLKMMEQILPK